MRHNEEAESEGDKDFVSAMLLLYGTNYLLIRFHQRKGFGKLIPPFLEIIKKKGWDFFSKHKAPSFTALTREFYSNMVEMKEDSVYIRGYGFLLGIRELMKYFS